MKQLLKTAFTVVIFCSVSVHFACSMDKDTERKQEVVQQEKKRSPRGDLGDYETKFKVQIPSLPPIQE